MTAKLIYDFDEYCEGGRDVLGGKGLGLAEMTALDLPVPFGFTVTTEACRHHLAHPGPLPVELREEIVYLGDWTVSAQSPTTSH